MEKKVVILGNGFDLACDLKSRYSDFFENRIDEELVCLLNSTFNDFKDRLSVDGLGFKMIFEIGDYKENKNSEQFYIWANETYNKLKESKLTFWDLVFYFFGNNSNDLQWQHVEQRMLEFLNTPKELVEIPSLNLILSALKHNSRRKANIKTLFCLHLAFYLSGGEKFYDQAELMDYLHKELRSFEKGFSEYIKSVESDEYRRKACKLLLDITNATTVPKIEDVVFSFNYTNPFNVYNPNLSVVNVHGTVEDDNIIFGIDQERIDPNLDIFRFTKTFRQMTETKLATKYEQEILPSRDEVTEIAFYGHSLSSLDYSYFQTIFDYYDLYGSKVLLVFYYKVYKGITKEAMELDLADKISKLLYSYSESIDNVKRGKNLMHKLLLEKRLFIKEITSER
ncbi:bacteriophage abortive infection AbiH family protein [Enterococcus faecalis]|uniref:bacteriophage abortive infection AbiH family protein n=1 Tax=Enterococcus faecalis TaxID=1351 RepID=UPI0021E809F4|nr:bacteriophage abortive infection AbiH family protein [Enterococcus faecalis]MCV3154041.1 bacteriophage abortive infection AbiH family protein [Enterococcus faecalis]